jgi:hypothetical protein
MNQPNPNFGNGEVGGSANFTPPVHGYMEGHGDVTVSFGQGSAEGQALIRDGHIESRSQFDGHKGARGHDHIDPNGPDGGSNRGFFSGW